MPGGHLFHPQINCKRLLRREHAVHLIKNIFILVAVRTFVTVTLKVVKHDHDLISVKMWQC